jgi:flagellar secretion chaperone FliS
MNGQGNRRAMAEYREVDLPSQVQDADPHTLVQLMLDGAVARVAAAQGALEANDTPLKCELIGKAIGLVEGLRVSLDMERGGDLAANLEALYRYMVRRLLEANLRSDAAILTEVGSLLREVQTGWREMGQSLARSEPHGGEQNAVVAAP